MTENKAHGLLVIDKPTGMTSRGVVNHVQRWFPKRTRLGHAGTLDPLATGVLVLCVGVATRLVEYVQQMDKEYLTDIVLGAVSDTDDADGKITVVDNPPLPSLAEIETVLTAFTGQVEQVPPEYSAIKVAGKRSYDLARSGATVPLAAREVRIDAVQVLEFEYPRLRLLVRCGKGTYIRSIARDLGQKLGCGAYVGTLRRLRIGPFTPELGVPLEGLAGKAEIRLLPVAWGVGKLPRVELDEQQMIRFRQGQLLGVEKTNLPGLAGDEIAVFHGEELVGTGNWDLHKDLLVPNKVLMYQ